MAEAIREAHPDVDLVIAADDDWKTEGNPGLTNANEAARAVNAKLAVPVWPKDRRGDADTDFNDLLLLDGPQAVRNCIERALLTPKKDKIESAGSKTKKGKRSQNFNDDEEKNSSQ